MTVDLRVAILSDKERDKIQKENTREHRLAVKLNNQSRFKRIEQNKKPREPLAKTSASADNDD